MGLLTLQTATTLVAWLWVGRGVCPHEERPLQKTFLYEFSLFLFAVCYVSGQLVQMSCLLPTTVCWLKIITTIRDTRLTKGIYITKPPLGVIQGYFRFLWMIIISDWKDPSMNLFRNPNKKDTLLLISIKVHSSAHSIATHSVHVEWDIQPLVLFIHEIILLEHIGCFQLIGGDIQFSFFFCSSYT